MEPELITMVNVTNDLRLGVGASYRFVTENDAQRILGSKIGGWGVTFTLMYGKI
jgi:hypothetical protein